MQRRETVRRLPLRARTHVRTHTHTPLDEELARRLEDTGRVGCCATPATVLPKARLSRQPGSAEDSQMATGTLKFSSHGLKILRVRVAIFWQFALIFFFVPALPRVEGGGARPRTEAWTGLGSAGAPAYARRSLQRHCACCRRAGRRASGAAGAGARERGAAPAEQSRAGGLRLRGASPRTRRWP